MALSLLCLSIVFLRVLLFTRAPFCVALVCVRICVLLLVVLVSCQYLPSDWIERLTPLRKPNRGEG